MNRKINLLAGAVLAASVGTASALPVTFQDDNLDFHLDSNLLPTSGPLQDGDVLLAVLEYNNFQGTPIGPDKELTGIAVIQASITPGGFSFTPYAGGLNSVPGVSVTGGAAGEGAMLALWEDTTPDLNVDASLVTTGTGLSCSTLAECITQATDGTLFLTAGFAAGDNSYWDAFGTPLLANPDLVLLEPVADIEGFFNAGLSILDVGISGATDDERLSGDYGPVDLLLNGTVNGGGFDQWGNTTQRDSLVADGFVATTDTDMQIDIPSPAPLALMGLAGLLGFGGLKRRRKAA